MSQAQIPNYGRHSCCDDEKQREWEQHEDEDEHDQGTGVAAEK